jgi:Flp pilus assembly protein protease CpaA
MLDILGFYINSAEIFSVPNLFLIGVAIFWMIIASIQDIRRREVENWWNFSLIILVLAFRALFSIESANYWYFLWGLVGLLIGFILANAFYYARMFAGGDAKLLMALGTILPFSLDFETNLEIMILFLVLFLLAGSVYGILYSLFSMAAHFREFKKEFSKQFKKYKTLTFCVIVLSLAALVIFYVYEFYLGIALSAIIFLTPFLLIYAKSIEESCMIKSAKVKDLTIGDWLYRPIKIGKKSIKPNWEGLSERELKLIQAKYRAKVLVKQGLPFVPAFLIAFLLMLALIYFNILA